MSATRRQMKLGAFFHPTGHHIASWRHPDAYAGAAVDFAHYTQLAQTAERGKFDLLFLADSPAMRNWPPERQSRVATYIAGFEPITLLSALAAVTKHIGLVATATTTYNEPLHIARKFASLDHISGGRAGWNLVTSTNPKEALNFSKEAHLAHDDRYDRAREFAEVVRGLWDSWDEDAFVRNKASGRYFDPERLHVLDHKGEHFSVRGPLNVPRPPQGHPVIVQAGSSDVGKELAAEIAEVVFTAHQTLENAKKFYDDLKGRLAKYGRTADDIKVMPGVSPVIGRTQDEADEKFAKLQSLVHPEIGLALLGELLGNIDLSPYPLDGPLPEIVKSELEPARVQDVHGHGEERAAHDPRAVLAHRRARPLDHPRHAADDRRSSRGLVQERRLRRLQRDAAVSAGRARRLRRVRRAGAAAARRVPQGVRGADAAGKSRAAAAGEPFHGHQARA